MNDEWKRKLQYTDDNRQQIYILFTLQKQEIEDRKNDAFRKVPL